MIRWWCHKIFFQIYFSLQQFYIYSVHFDVFLTFRDILKLENLQEFNLSGNDLRSLPSNLGKHLKLQIIRANANHLKELPDFKRANNLKVPIFFSSILVYIGMLELYIMYYILKCNLFSTLGPPPLPPPQFFLPFTLSALVSICWFVLCLFGLICDVIFVYIGAGSRIQSTIWCVGH